jgi:hypothetical protein
VHTELDDGAVVHHVLTLQYRSTMVFGHLFQEVAHRGFGVSSDVEHISLDNFQGVFVDEAFHKSDAFLIGGNLSLEI